MWSLVLASILSVQSADALTVYEWALRVSDPRPIHGGAAMPLIQTQAGTTQSFIDVAVAAMHADLQAPGSVDFHCLVAFVPASNPSTTRNVFRLGTNRSLELNVRHDTDAYRWRASDGTVRTHVGVLIGEVNANLNKIHLLGASYQGAGGAPTLDISFFATYVGRGSVEQGTLTEFVSGMISPLTTIEVGRNGGAASQDNFLGALALAFHSGEMDLTRFNSVFNSGSVDWNAFWDRTTLIGGIGYNMKSEEDGVQSPIPHFGEDINNTNVLWFTDTGDYTVDWLATSAASITTSTGAAALKYTDPFDAGQPWAGQWAKTLVDRGAATSVAGVAPLAASLRALQTASGVKYVTLCGPSLVLWGHDALNERWFETATSGFFVSALAPKIAGVHNVAVGNTANVRQFAFDQQGVPAQSGTILGVASLGTWYQGLFMSGGAGSPGGVLLEPGARLDSRWMPMGVDDAPSFQPATLLDRNEALDAVIIVKGPWGNVGEQAQVTITPHKAADMTTLTRDTTGFESPEIVETNTTVVNRAFSTGAGDTYTPGTKTLVLAGTSLGFIQGQSLTVQWGATTDLSAGGKMTSVVEGGGNTTIVLEYPFQKDANPATPVSEAEIDGDMLRAGPLEFVEGEFTQPAVTAGALARGLGFDADVGNDTYVLVGLRRVSRTGVSGWSIGTHARGAHSLEDQIDQVTTKSITPSTNDGGALNSMANALGDLWLVLANTYNGDTVSPAGKTGDYIDLVLTAHPTAEVVVMDLPVGSPDSIWQNSVEDARADAIARDLAYVSISDHASLGDWLSTPGLWYDGRHMSLEGYRLWVEAFFDAADGIVIAASPTSSGTFIASGFDSGLGF